MTDTETKPNPETETLASDPAPSDEAGQTNGVGPTKNTRLAVLKSLLLGVGLIGAIFLGGMGIAWIIQGPIFFEHKTLTLEAKILGNAPGALGIDASMVKREQDRANFKDTRHWFVVGYPGCEEVKQGFWIPDEPLKRAKQATLLNEIRRCFLGMKEGATVPVTLRTRKRRSSGEQSWRVQSIGTCEAEALTTMMLPNPDAKKCDWM